MKKDPSIEILLLRWEHRIDELENRVNRTDAHENQALGIQACVDDLREVFKGEQPDLLEELRNIANADLAGMQKDFGADADRQFRLWAQNRARAVIAKVETETERRAIDVSGEPKRYDHYITLHGQPPQPLRSDSSYPDKFTNADYCPACGMLRSQCDCIDPVNQP